MTSSGPEGLLKLPDAHQEDMEKLRQMAEQFLAGHPANHVLLYGERGTGKSSAVKGLLSRFGGRGLRVVEVQKADLMHLPDVVAALRGSPHRFLLFCDDLSFDVGETTFRELKAALESSAQRDARVATAQVAFAALEAAMAGK